MWFGKRMTVWPQTTGTSECVNNSESLLGQDASPLPLRDAAICCESLQQDTGWEYSPASILADWKYETNPDRPRRGEKSGRNLRFSIVRRQVEKCHHDAKANFTAELFPPCDTEETSRSSPKKRWVGVGCGVGVGVAAGERLGRITFWSLT